MRRGADALRRRADPLAVTLRIRSRIPLETPKDYARTSVINPPPRHMDPQRRDTQMNYTPRPPAPAAGLRNKLAERARPYLEPGEQIRAILGRKIHRPIFGNIPITFLIIFIIITWNRVPAVLWETMAVVAVALWIVYFAFSRPPRRGHRSGDRGAGYLQVGRNLPPRMNRPTRLRLRRPRDFGPTVGALRKVRADNTEYGVRRFHTTSLPDVALIQ